MGVRWYPIVILICFSLMIHRVAKSLIGLSDWTELDWMTNDTEHFFMYEAICIASLGKMSKSFACFKTG